MKLKMNNQVGLTICVVTLLVLCTLSIGQPMMFDRQKKQREREVSARMEKIWKAEQDFRKQNNVYTANLQQLIKAGLLADSLQFIPYAQGKRFKVTTNIDITRSGRQVPSLTIVAQYDDYLWDMNANSVANLIEEANKRGSYPGLKMSNAEDSNP